jgi:hypothetical protein
MVSLEFFHWHNPSGRTTALGSTQPLTEMSTKCVGLTTLPPSCADCLKIWEPQLLEPFVKACNGTYLLTYSMEQSPWEADQFSQLTKKFPALYGTRRFFTVLTSALHLSLGLLYLFTFYLYYSLQCPVLQFVFTPSPCTPSPGHFMSRAKGHQSFMIVITTRPHLGLIRHNGTGSKRHEAPLSFPKDVTWP